MDNLRKLKYSAGAVSKGFWFQGFRKYNELQKEGFYDEEIKLQQDKDNIMMAPSEAYGIKMINEVSRRFNALPVEVSNLFFDLSVFDQKLLNLLGIMMTDKLFFEFMNEVYREKLITDILDFDNVDTRIFIKNKSEQSERVSNFTSQTKKRLEGAYRTYLKEANLLDEIDSTNIKKPILDINLEKTMKTTELYPFLRIFLGE